MLRRLLTLLAVLTLACASAQAYVPERSLLHTGELASQAKTAPRGFAAQAEPAAKEKSPVSPHSTKEKTLDTEEPSNGRRFYAQQRYYRPGLGRFNRVDPWEGDPLRPITLNKYLYANGNPLYYTDPTGMYGESGHYYTVLLAAKEAGYSVDDSLRIALYAQLPDQVGRFDAINRLSGSVNPLYPSYELVPRNGPRRPSRAPGNMELRRSVDGFSVEDIQRGIHVLTGEHAEAVTARARALLVSSESIEVAGIAAHALGDSFAHRVLDAEAFMYNTYAGHYRDRTNPDSPVVRPELYGEYAKALVMALAERRGEQITAERADRFSAGLVAIANAKRSELQPRLSPILVELAQARAEHDESMKNGSVSDEVFRRVRTLEQQVHFVLNSGEPGFREAIAERAGSMIAAEDRGGQVILRPQQHQLGWLAGGKGHEQSQLNEFFRRAERPRREGEPDVYANDRDAQTLTGAVKRYFEDLSTKFQGQP